MSRLRFLFVAGVLSLATTSCDEPTPGTDGDADGDLDGDADGDADAGGDGDVDGDGDGDADGDGDGGDYVPTPESVDLELLGTTV